MMNLQKIKLGLNLCFNNYIKKSDNIALVVNTFDKGGLEQVVLNLYKQYRFSGYKAYILVQEDLVGELAKYVDNPDDIYVFQKNTEKFLTFCYQHNIGVLHYHYNVFNLEKFKKLGFKIIYTLHNVYAWMSRSEISERARILSHADHIVAVSSFVKQYFCKRTLFEPSKIKVIVNGINLEEISKGTKYSNKRQEFGIKNRDIIFINLASFHRGKHQAIIIGAMEEVIKKRNDIKILYVGGKGDESYYNEIMDMLRRSSARKNIIHAPYVPREEMGSFLSEFGDALILPSLQEGCSNAVLEAFCCGMPMIISNVGNAQEMKGYESCLIVNTAYDDVVRLRPHEIVSLSKEMYTKNYRELASAILNMAEHIDEYKQKAVLNKMKADLFSDVYMARQYIELLK